MHYPSFILALRRLRVRSLVAGLALCGLMAVPVVAFAESSEPLTTQSEQWVPQATALIEEADTLLRADHNPRTKQYYQAAELYQRAGALLDRAAYQTGKQGTQEAADLKAQAKQVYLKGYRAKKMGNDRESRGLI